MFEMSRLPTPIICVVIGEGGSGGALGIGVGDRVAMLEHAYYSVISPEGCAGILWKSHTFKERAAEALKMTSKDLLKLGVIDAIIPEPLGGAHRDHHLMANRLKVYLRNNLRELLGRPIDELLEARYQKFRRIGAFEEGRHSCLPSAEEGRDSCLPPETPSSETTSAPETASPADSSHGDSARETAAAAQPRAAVPRT